MKITRPELELADGAARAFATVTWEDNDRPPLEIYFETDQPHCEVLAADPNAFLTAAFVPAFYHGERRVAIEGVICPVLEEGLSGAAQLLGEWYRLPSTYTRPVIEPTGRHALAPVSPPRTGLFLSGGVDSTFTLWNNRRLYPPDHPASFRDAIYAYGVDMAGIQGRDRRGVYEAGSRAMEPVAKEAGLELIRVRTNIKHLDDRYEFFVGWSTAAILAAIGHAFCGRLSGVSIAATGDTRCLPPWGTHPLLDPLYSSSGLQLRHDGLRWLRIDKVRALLEWETALSNLRVCFNYDRLPEGQLNCGVCNKCAHTMLEILAAGGDLAKVASFPQDALTPQAVRDTVFVHDWLDARYVADLIDPLDAIGRGDLADVLRRKMNQHRRSQALGRSFGVLRRLRRLLRAGPRPPRA